MHFHRNFSRVIRDLLLPIFTFQASFRSYRTRRALFQKLRSDALADLNDCRLQKSKKSQVDYDKLGRVIAVIVGVV